MNKWMGLLVAAVLAAASTPSAHAAGNIKAGLKVGANLAKITGADATNAKNLIGLIGGGFVGIKLSTLVIQPEVLFSMKGTEVDTEKIKLSYLEVPVLVEDEFSQPQVQSQPVRGS